MARIVISPHADDEILGTGGIINKYSNELFYIIEVTQPTEVRQLELDKVIAECPNAAVISLGYKDQGISLQDIPVLADTLVKNISFVDPSHVYIPYPSLHQDHQIINHASLIALRRSKAMIFEYEYVEGLSQYNQFIPNYFEVLTKHDVDRKAALMSLFTSQAGYMRDAEAITALATIRGYSCNSPYAEGFRLIRGVAA